MPSKRSYFNVTLFRKNLTRFWPLWGGLSLAGSVMPLYLLLFLLGPYGAHISSTDAIYALYGAITVFLPAFTLVYALLAAMAVWSYLYQSRSTGMMHSLPLDRTTIFLTNTLSGLAIMLLPYVVVGAFISIVLLAFGLFPAAAIGQTILAVLGESLFYFATATLCAMITGHLLALPVFYFLGHFLAVLLQQVVAAFSSNFIFGYTPGSGTWADALSPTVFFYRQLGYSSTSSPEGVRTITLDNFWVVGVYALVGAALLILSLAVYRLRRSESAGEVVAYRPLRPLFRYGMALGFALTLGQVLYELVWRMPFNYGFRESYQMLPMWACMTAAGIIGYFVASMLLKKSLRVFRHSLRGPVMTAAMLAILCSCISLDLFHIAGNVPQANKVKEVMVYMDGERVYATQEDPQQMAEILRLHQLIVQSENAVKTELTEASLPIIECTLRYTLNDGAAMARSYTLPLDPQRWAEPNGGSYDAALNALYNSSDAAARLIAPPAGYELVTLYLYTYYGDNPEISAQQAKDIYAALQADAAQGLIRQVNVFDRDRIALGEIELNFLRPGTKPEEGPSSSYTSLTLSSRMVNTIKVLDQEGLLNQELQDLLREEIPASVPGGAETALAG